MNTSTRYRVLVGVIILLVALNITTLILLGLKKPVEESKPLPWGKEVNADVEQRLIPHRLEQELNLNPQQQELYHGMMEVYQLNKQENKLQLQELYREMMEELSLEHPDTVLLNQLAEQIGSLHQEQQKATIDHFLNMQNICSHEQYQMMHHKFMRRMGPAERQVRGMRSGNHRHQRGNRPLREN